MNIKKVLVANRGEIAARIFRTLNRMGIAGVAVYHAVDRDSPPVKLAAERIELQGETPVAAYLNADAIIAACQQTGAGAVHPGFGFLSENADFARRLHEAGITFIGPSADVIELMGDKVGARQFCLNNDYPIPPSVTDSGDEQQFVDAALALGMPLLIKAAAGGGGKGMQIVRRAEDFADAVKRARSEALRAFGDARVYAERYVDNPRHIEVQILADGQGKVLHLGERDCSIQRRFQKIIEEAPAPALQAELRQRICDTAVAIAQSANYRNAGTVEFVLSPDGEFYFLEMNTRLQVEHPVTEAITGIDLVEQQIRIAGGEALAFDQAQVRFDGHALELRLYAEDPEQDFMPTTGELLVYDLPDSDAVRLENGLAQGQRVTAAFDPMLAKLVVRGDNREQALAMAADVLAQVRIMGLTTNREFLQRVVSHPAFVAAEIDTGFIPRHREDLKSPPLQDWQRDLLLAATLLNNRDCLDLRHQPAPLHRGIGAWRN